MQPGRQRGVARGEGGAVPIAATRCCRRHLACCRIESCAPQAVAGSSNRSTSISQAAEGDGEAGERSLTHTYATCCGTWHTHTQHLRLRLRLRLCRHLSLSSSYDFAFNLVASLLLIAILNMLHFIVATHTHTDTQEHSHTHTHTLTLRSKSSPNALARCGN